MLLAGDEFGRTQNGNNNAYCQDNEISWIDWTLLRTNRDLQEFVQRLIQFRKDHPILRRDTFLTGKTRAGGNAPDIHWLGPQGHGPDWTNGRCVACLLDGRPENSGLAVASNSLLLCFNAGEHGTTFHIPDPPGRPWTLE